MDEGFYRVNSEGVVFPRECCLKTNPKRERGRTLHEILKSVEHPPSLTLRVSYAASPRYLIPLREPCASAGNCVARKLVIEERIRSVACCDYLWSRLGIYALCE